MSDDRDGGESDDLDERVAELEARVRELRTELGRPPEGPLGLPRPPTPREVLSFTGEYAIPTAIAVLEANVRALETLQRVVRVLDPERSVVSEEGSRLQTRAADASRATLDRLESALEDAEKTIRENDLPREPEARDLLEDARRINREIRDRVDSEQRSADDSHARERAADETPDTGDGTGLEGGTTIELTDGDDEDDGEGEAGGDDRHPEVDVEAELRSIKDELAERENGPERTDDASADSEKPDGASADSEKPDGASADSEESDDASTDSEESDGASTDSEESDGASADSEESDDAS